MAEPDYTDETWRVIPFADSYAISDYGRLKWIKPDMQGNIGRTVAAHTSSQGYRMLRLWIGGRKIAIGVHRLICFAFNGPPPSEAHQAAHRDGDKLHNRPSNIYWATVKQNAEDRVRHGTQVRGDRHWSRTNPEKVRRGDRHMTHVRPEMVLRGAQKPNALLTDEQVMEIRQAPRYHGSGVALALRYGVHKSVITAVRNRKSYAHV